MNTLPGDWIFHMMTDLLRNPNLKLERAKTHIRHLDSVIRSFRKNRPYRMTEEDAPDGINKHVKVKLKRQMPPEISLIAADAVHNLRVSLDQLACRLAEANGASSTSGISFPFGKDAQIFEQEARRKIKKLHPDATLAIHQLKPYQGGNDLLWAVNALDVTDKHREIVAIGSISPSARVNLIRGQRIETPDWTGTIIHGPIEITANPVWNVLDESAIVMTVPRNSTFDGEIKLTLDIAYREIEPVRGKPIVDVLNQLANLVEEILLNFGRRFF